MMRTSASVRGRYDELRADYLRVKEEGDKLLSSLREARWHYESRLKTLESYALKLETGRFSSGTIDDFFAATFVVENRSALRRAEARLKASGLFVIEKRKPEDDCLTHHPASDFAFDDVRLYLRIAEAESRPPTGVESLMFELQIKTFLQHAWSIATHDLVYKGDDVDWKKERIAFQVKAMLEHAEVTIEHAQRIASAEGEKSTKELREQKELLEWVRRKWSSEHLPQDQTRLARNIHGVLKAAKVELSELDPALERETLGGRGAQLLSVSPYGAVLDVIARNFPERLSQLGDSRLKVFLPEEQAELCDRLPPKSVRAIRT